MQNLMNIHQSLTMSSREISELTGKRHPDVKRDIEVMLDQLSEDVSNFARIYFDTMNRKQTEYQLDRRHVECLLTGYSATLRMKVIDRWQELEEAASGTTKMSQAELIAAMAMANVQQERRLNQVESKVESVTETIEQIKQGTIPQGYQGYSHLHATYGLSNAKCKQLVMAWSVPHKKVPHVAPGGQVTQMAVVHEDAFSAALKVMMSEAERRGTQWYHAKMGRLSIAGWDVAA